MSSAPVLSMIAAATRKRVDQEKIQESLLSLKSQAKAAREPHDFIAELLRKPEPRVIAEVKLASPSEGDIFVDADPVEVAAEYLGNGAAAVSVLTEPDHFKGSRTFLREIRRHHPEALLLMKDFVLDDYQLYQARAYGADAVLLIVDLIPEDELKHLYALALELHLTPLVEVHSESEMQVAVGIGARLIGVNNRDLRTMKTTLETSHRLAGLAPAGTMLISESGLGKGEDIQDLARTGYSAFLIGTHFMKSRRPGESLKTLIGEAK